MKSELTTQIHQYLTSAPSSLFAQQTVTVLAHWQGDTNLLWRVRAGDQDAVVKLFLDAGQARSRRQFDGHQLFAPLGLAPLPMWADRYPHGLSRQLIVYRWVEGETVALDDPDTLIAWGAAIGTLHASPTTDVRRFSPHPVNLDFYWRIEQGSIDQVDRWLASSGVALRAHFQWLAEAAKSLVQESLSLWATARPAPIHGDLSREHTLLHRGRILLLDWEMFGLGDPALDVARLLQREAQMLEAEQIARWLDSYLQSVNQPLMAERINIYQRLLEVHNVIYLLVGLRQHTMGQVESDLQAALPFIQSALSTALDLAASALRLPGVPDAHKLADEFMAWLGETAAPART